MKLKSATLLAIVGSIILAVIQMVFTLKYYMNVNWHSFTIREMPIYSLTFLMVIGYLTLTIFFISFYRHQKSKKEN